MIHEILLLMSSLNRKPIRCIFNVHVIELSSSTYIHASLQLVDGIIFYTKGCKCKLVAFYRPHQFFTTNNDVKLRKMKKASMSNQSLRFQQKGFWLMRGKDLHLQLAKKKRSIALFQRSVTAA